MRLPKSTVNLMFSFAVSISNYCFFKWLFKWLFHRLIDLSVGRSIRQSVRQKVTFCRFPLLVSSGWNGGNSWLVDSGEFSGQSNSELRTTQKQIIVKQDESLDQLAAVLSKQKDIAVTIGQVRKWSELPKVAKLIERQGNEMNHWKCTHYQNKKVSQWPSHWKQNRIHHWKFRY